jgi:hypothetical protein
MIAFAQGYGTFRYGKIIMANTSPYAYSSFMILRDSSNMGTNELRGIYIKDEFIILVGIFDTTLFKFKIATVNFSTSKIFFKETIPMMTKG